MSDLRLHPLQPNVEVIVDSTPASLPDAVMARIEDIWQGEKQKRGDSLFDGQLYSLRDLRPDRLTGTLVRYKHFVAQLRDPALFDVLQIRPLGVTGLLLCADGLVCGKRGLHVQQEPGLWELAPSGGVDAGGQKSADRIDLARQILVELHEEIGIDPSVITTPLPILGAVEVLSTHVTDIGLLLRCPLSGAEIHRTFAALGNPEYSELEIVPLPHVLTFLEEQGAAFAGVSRELLKLAAPLLEEKRSR